MYLYHHIGVAIAFSPRLEALLAEAAFRATHIAPRLTLIHAGTHTDSKEDQLRAALESVGLPIDTATVWAQGGSPDAAILSAIEENHIDLLLAGALEKERAFRYYLGSVAHNLVREAPCSLVLFTEPSTRPEPIRRIVFVTDFSEGAMVALTKVIRFAELEDAEMVYVLRVVPQYGEAIVISEGVRRERIRNYQAATITEERALLQDMVDAVGHSKVSIEPHLIEGHGGYVAAQFVRAEQADLLVMPSANQRSHFFQRLFPSDMEWVLREIPCTLWVERERLD